MKLFDQSKFILYIFLLFHIFTHSSLIWMILYSDAHHWLVSFIVYFFMGGIGVAITYHRLIAHKSFTAPKWFLYFGIVCGILAGIGSPIQWCAIHRKHHRYSDTEKDPHNPKTQGFFKVQFLTMLIPNDTYNYKYIPDLLRQKDQLFFNKYYWYFHLVYAVILLYLDPFSIIYAYLFPALIFWHAMNALGTFAHTSRFGYRNYETKDSSVNLWFLGYFLFGEGWHNNHHHSASSYKFGHKWWEYDLCYHIINLVRVKNNVT
jgi:sn-1 stearoyl-lipid 9-desaturase